MKPLSLTLPKGEGQGRGRLTDKPKFEFPPSHMKGALS